MEAGGLTALYVILHGVKSGPLVELPKICGDLREALALLHMTLTC